MNNLTLNKLIEHLQRIRDKYGNMPVEGNVVCDERGLISSLCVLKDDEYDELELKLLIEIEVESRLGNSIPLFSVYEYPSMKEV